MDQKIEIIDSLPGSCKKMKVIVESDNQDSNL